MDKIPRFCRHAGCCNLTTNSYCDTHMSDVIQQRAEADRRRGTARQRGYTSRWSKYSKAFLSRADNKFCKLHLDDRCNILAQCVDHIDPPKHPQDIRFWDKSNHQAACIHCNSVKGHRKMLGTYEYGEEIRNTKHNNVNGGQGASNLC